ncbi:MAG: L-serine ammonia-lyase, iron-sulfur-dependent, subunit alpha [Liquorilactobacillus ghanensis]|uniref:L-cysteine desulfidase family protein n=1 Tax=Liquorilactobacillus ghanensis TaxID=399370 RepID=UPI0039EC963D
MYNEKLLLDNLHAGVIPATGCTEPIAVAFAAANCMSYIEDYTYIKSINVYVSPNIMKNTMAVLVPGVEEPGLAVAAAAGVIAGNPNAGLGVISNINQSQIPIIKKMAHCGKIKTKIADVQDDLYVNVGIETESENIKVYIAGNHTNIYKIEKNGQCILKKSRPIAHEKSKLKEYMQTVSLRDIWNFSINTQLEKISFMKEADTINWQIAKEGLKHSYGLNLGKSIIKSKDVDFDNDLQSMILAYTTAASDARMGGAMLPAMSNSGSGNQGITASVPLSVVSRYLNVDDEKIIRAQTLSHLTAIYAHSFLPILGAFCATDTAAMGAAAGICYLFGKNYDVMSMAIKNMAGDAPGMICDGAGASCAMKVGTSVSSMYKAVQLAFDGICIPATNGLVCEDVDLTIRGIGHLNTEGLKNADSAILDIMMDKIKIER